MTHMESPTALNEQDEEEVEVFLHPVVSMVKEKWRKARDSRRIPEDRWNRANSNFRGDPIKKQAFLETEKSQVVVKVTKTKTLAGYGQLLDILLANNKVPILVKSTPIPEGTTDNGHISLTDPKGEQEEGQPDVIGFEGDGEDVQPNESLSDRAARIASKFFGGAKVQDGEATSREEKQVDPAALAAERMQKLIQDQLVESDGITIIKRALLESCILGTGVIKGPFLTNKEYPAWSEDGRYQPVFKPVPMIEHVSVWDFYPDPQATSILDAEYTVQRHKKSAKQIRELRDQPFFRAAQIDMALERGANYVDEDHELDRKDTSEYTTENRYEVLEYWGSISRELLDTIDPDAFELPERMEGVDHFDVNCWVVNDVIIRMVLNPFNPSRLPYQAFPYEEDPYSFWGVGIPENMDDSQTLMNGFVRLAVDNAALAGSMMLEVDEGNLAPGQDMKIHTGKVWRRAHGAPGNALNAIKFNSTFSENMNVYDQFRRLADETTGIPSFAHGQTGVTGVGRTASGISMLMGAASLSTKTVVKNIDDYLLGPLAKAFFAFNMQFNFDKDAALGDLSVSANGVSSILTKESQSQRMLQLMQVSQGNPNMAARLNDAYMLEEIAKILDLDAEKILLSQEDAAIKMAMMASVKQATQGPAPDGANPANEVGTIGGAPAPGTPQFTGTEGGNGGDVPV